MILIVAPPTDDHAVLVARELQRRGRRVVILDVAELPQHAAISIEFEPGRPMEARLERASCAFSFDEVETAWLRRVSRPDVRPNLADPGFAAAEVHHALVGLAQALGERVRWVNRLGALAMDGGWGKVRQLDAARSVGLEIPRTLVTNSPARALAFVDSCPGGAVYKPLASVELPGRDQVWRALFTTEVDRDYLAARVERVANAPCVFQEKLPKARELRVTVMGERVFACALESQSVAESRLDYRHRYREIPRSAYALPVEVEAGLLHLHSSLGLVFGTADVVVTPEGRHVFLETNQQGQWLWTEDAFGEGALTRAFCDLLEASR